MKWVTVMAVLVGTGFATGAGAGLVVSYDCVALTGKTGTIDTVCALFGQRLALAHSGAPVSRAPDAGIVLAVDTASPRSFVARIDIRGQPVGALRGIARHDADLDEAALAEFLDDLLQSSGGEISR